MAGEALDGDRLFVGVESRLEAGALGPGFIAMGRNVRLRDGKVCTRRGIMKMPWFGVGVGAPFPLEFAIDFSGVAPFVTIYGAGRFEDPNDVEWIIVAGALTGEVGGVYACRPGNGMVKLALPAGESITAEVAFVQGFDRLFLLRGDEISTLVMDRLDDGFRALAVTEDQVEDGRKVLPNGLAGVFVQNRILIGHDRDLVAVGDAQVEVYDAAVHDFRINQGSSDRVVGLAKFSEQTVVVAKGSSIYVLSNFVPDAETGLLTDTYVEEVTRQFGFVARRSIVQVGSELFGLSQLGVMGIRQTEQDKLRGVQLPLSAPMQAVMERVNWQYAAGAAGAYWDSKYYLALPLDDAEGLGNDLIWEDAFYDLGILVVNGLVVGRRYRFVFGVNDGELDCGAAGAFSVGEDGAQIDFVATQETVTLTTAAGSGSEVTGSLKMLMAGVNNAVIVYDFVRGQWDGYDEGRGLWVIDFVTLEYAGRERLFYAGADGLLSLYEEGFEDEALRSEGYALDGSGNYVGTGARGIFLRGIETEILLRGYGLRALQNDGYQKADMNESRVRHVELAIRTWAPGYSIFAVPDGVSEEEAALEGATKSRVRYVSWGEADWDETNINDDHERPYREDYAVELIEEGMELGKPGVRMNLHQDFLERVRVNGRAQTCQVRVVSVAGRLELLRASVMTSGGRKRVGVLV